MGDLLQYIKDNYVLFTSISVILILALIGYIVDSKSGRDITIKPSKKQEKDTDKVVNVERI